jgi:hypothetical protein
VIIRSNVTTAMCCAHASTRRKMTRCCRVLDGQDLRWASQRLFIRRFSVNAGSHNQFNASKLSPPGQNSRGTRRPCAAVCHGRKRRVSGHLRLIASFSRTAACRLGSLFIPSVARSSRGESPSVCACLRGARISSAAWHFQWSIHSPSLVPLSLAGSRRGALRCIVAAWLSFR